jgi:type VI secretion system protein ImpK
MAGPALIDATRELSVLMVELGRSGASFSDPRRFRKQVHDALRTFEAEAARLGGVPEDVEDAKYAIVATIDELVHFGGHAHELGFDIEPLQAEIFGDRNAGVRFFERLSKVRTRSRDALEVFHLCLCLGFRGRHRVGGEAEVDGLLDRIAKDLGHGAMALSPRALPKGPPAALPRPFPWLLAGIGAVALAVLSAVALYFVLDAEKERALEVLRVLGSS